MPHRKDRGIDAPPNHGDNITAEAEPVAVSLPEVEAVPAKDENKISILLVEDHVVMRKGLAKLLQEHPDLLVVGEADDGLEAVALAEKLKPDVIIMDLGLPQISGFEATRQISAKYPGICVIGLSVHENDEFAEALCKLGASTYLTKTEPPERLIAAIRACRKSGGTSRPKAGI